MSQHSAQIYDEVPFPNLPAPGSQPERLATIAVLRGLEPADVAQARVLELGCASGQNLLPTAERNPGATFLGIDLSARQIEMARQSAADLRLTNIEFRQADLARLPADLGTFDYIIAQAVYSWVDAPTRDELLAVCSRHLAPQGVAYVSYNVYPGWHVHDMLRAMMRYEARNARTPAETIAAARRLLSFLNDSLPEENPFSGTVKPQVAQLMAQSDAYLLHDHLAEVNDPVYYRHFVAHARRHALAPAGDATLGIRLSDYLAPDTEQRLAQIAPDPIDREQYRDIVRNRAIRQTLLCHAEIELARSLRPDALAGMYLSSPLQPESAEVSFRPGNVERFTTPSGLRISTAVPLIKAALVHLGAAWPSYVAFDDLATAAAERLGGKAAATALPEASEVTRLRDNLLQCCAGGIVELHRQSAPFAAVLSATPCASPLARWQAERGDVATNRKHEAIRLEDFERHVLRLLDGTRDRGALVDALATLAAEGKLIIMDEQQQVVQGSDATRRSLELALPWTLERLAQNAFLVA